MQKLSPQEVHVWHTSFSDHLQHDEVAGFLTTLSSDEQARAQRFHFAKDRDRFIIARGLLRKILSHYLSVKPEQLQFNYNPYGKPELLNYTHIQFNLSHSHDIALFAIGQQSVGVDIEYLGRTCDINAIAARYFSVEEYQTINSLAGNQKIQAFFNGWARKEAFLKAIGKGLSYPLNQVEVTLHPEQSANFIAFHDGEHTLSDWSLFALELKTNYAAALVTKGNPSSLHVWHWK